jgi:hypothetical protein
MEIITRISRLERLPVSADEVHDRDEEIGLAYDDFGYPIHLADTLDIDRSTMECRVNGGDWTCVYDAETGCADYPSTEDLDESELHGLAPLLAELSDIGVDVRAYRVRYGWAPEPAPAANATQM